MVEVEVICPSCGQKGGITVSTDSFYQAGTGLLAVNVPLNAICLHNFIAYIDKNFDVRDYFIVDFSIDVPEPIKKNEENELENLLKQKYNFDIDIIKLNISAILLTHLLKSIFNKKKIILIFDLTFLYNQIINFFKYIFQNSFNFDILLITEKEYKNNKKKLKKEYIILEDNKIFNDHNNILEKKGLKIEKRFVDKFFKENEHGVSYIVLKNDIIMAYNLSKEIIKIIEDHKNSEELGKAKIINMLEERNGKKLSPVYLEYLLGIVKNYFNFNLSSIQEYYFPAFGI